MACSTAASQLEIMLENPCLQTRNLTWIILSNTGPWCRVKQPRHLTISAITAIASQNIGNAHPIVMLQYGPVKNYVDFLSWSVI